MLPPLGAGSAIAAVARVKAIVEGWVPPTLGLEAAPPECDLDLAPNVGRAKRRA
jgi:3-oxoacyl-[acyl-carrier-protein] synthase II